MAEKTWPEVKAVLDDPSVDPGMKTMLLDSWKQEHPAPGWAERLGWPQELQDMTDAQEAEVDKYAKAYNAENALPFGAIKLDDAYDAAKKSGDQAGYNEREEKKAVDEGKTTLDGKQPPGSGGSGTQTSDELFDAAAPALKLFQTFGSLLAKIPDDCRGNTRPLDFQKDIQARFDEQRGISFKNFMDDAEHFKTGSTTSDQTSTDTGTALKTLFQSWTGQGADSASDHYNKEIQPKAQKLVQTLDDANAATTTAVSTIFQLCKGKADAVVKNYTDTVGKADFNMAQRVVNVANGEHADVSDLQPIAGWMDLNFGTDLVKTLNDDGCCDEDDIKNHGIDLAKQWIQNAFNPDMWDRLYMGFDKTCKDTLDLVNQAYDALDEVMGKIKNEFEGSTEPSGSTQPSQSGGPGTSSGPGGGGPGDSGPGAGSGGPGAGGGPGAPSTPSATPPGGTDNPQEVADAAKKEGEQGTNPYTGKPMEVNPETGEPYPIDPKTGEAIKDGGDEPETLKVQQGDKTIEMAEPDKDGKMDIKVGEGQGDPKDYKLDWGDGKDGAAGQAGAAAQQGAGDGKPGPDGTYQPGPDGKIHIQDGDLKITAERPDGPDGPTVVTVDDGSGTPTTYTLGDDKNPADAAGKDGASASEGAAAQQDTAGRAGSGLDGAAGQAGSGVDGGAAGQAGSGLDDAAGPAGSGTGGAVGGEGVGGGAVGTDGGSPVGEVSTMPTGAGGLTPDGVAADAGTDGGAAGGSGDGSGGAGATVPASGGAGGGGLDPVGAGIGGTGGGGAPEGAVSGTLGATDSLSPGNSTGAAVQQGQPSLGMQPVGSADAAAAMQQQQGSSSGGLGSMGGMPMMGGGGAGGEGGGDQERSSRGYRIDGGIFNSGGAGGRITGSLDDEGDRSVADRSASQR